MWKSFKDNKPPLNEKVLTKIEDEKGSRNEQHLIYDGKLFWATDKSMYVYYTPTHWKEC